MLILIGLAVAVGLYFAFKLPSFKRDMSIEKRAIVLTGAGSGIGLESAKKFLDLGAIVFACDMNDKGLATITSHKNCIPVHLDVTSKSDLQNAEELVRKQLDELKNAGRLINNQLFAIVNCAGIPKLTRVALVEKDDSELEKTFAVNVFGTHRMNKLFYPLLEKNNVGIIINIASVLASVAFPFGGFYSASKYAVKGYTDTLRRELIGRVRVTCINPGFTATPMINYTKDLAVGGQKQELMAPTDFNTEMETMRVALLDRYIMRFLQTPDKVADMIVASVISSNAPGHVVAEIYALKRVLWFFSQFNSIIDFICHVYWPAQGKASVDKKTK